MAWGADSTRQPPFEEGTLEMPEATVHIVKKGESAIAGGRSRRSRSSARSAPRKVRRGRPCPEAGVSGWFLRTVQADPEVLRFGAKVSVWGRWFIWAVYLVQLAYRPEFWIDTHREYLFLQAPLVVFNGLVHYRLHRGWAVTWRWLLFLSAMDVALITGAIVMAGDFDIYFFVAYYPALALFAVVFTSLWLGLAWTTMVALVYAVVSFAVDPGLDLATGEEKALLGRIAAMYGIVGCVSLVARFERVRRQRSAERERELHRERIELSQAIHDTAAQTAYMVSMGIHRAMGMTGGANEELAETLAATSVVVQGGHLGAEASHRRGRALRGKGAGPGALVPRRQLLEDRLDSGGVAPDRDRAAPRRGDQGPGSSP